MWSVMEIGSEGGGNGTGGLRLWKIFVSEQNPFLGSIFGAFAINVRVFSLVCVLSFSWWEEKLSCSYCVSYFLHRSCCRIRKGSQYH